MSMKRRHHHASLQRRQDVHGKQNGSTLYMKDGVKMETTDDKTITMSGNKVARLDMENYKGNRK